MSSNKDQKKESFVDSLIPPPPPPPPVPSTDYTTIFNILLFCLLIGLVVYYFTHKSKSKNTVLTDTYGPSVKPDSSTSSDMLP